MSDTAVVSGAEQKWVVVAHILRPRGNKGEVAAELLTDFPERLKNVSAVYVGDAGRLHKEFLPRRVELQNFWLSANHPGQAVFHFKGSASISEAEKFRGLDVLVPFEERVTLPAGQYFVSDLIGCSVFENSLASSAVAPSRVGVVTDVQLTGGNVSGTPLLAVDTPRGEILIPLAADICKRIDTIAGRIEVVLPEGLRELNRESV